MMTYGEFKTAYTAAFRELMKYTPKQAGSMIWVERMAELSDAHPDWADAVEDEAIAAARGGE